MMYAETDLVESPTENSYGTFVDAFSIKLARNCDRLNSRCYNEFAVAYFQQYPDEQLLGQQSLRSITQTLTSLDPAARMSKLAPVFVRLVSRCAGTRNPVLMQTTIPADNDQEPSHNSQITMPSIHVERLATLFKINAGVATGLCRDSNIYNLDNLTALFILFLLRQEISGNHQKLLPTSIFVSNKYKILLQCYNQLYGNHADSWVDLYRLFFEEDGVSLDDAVTLLGKVIRKSKSDQIKQIGLADVEELLCRDLPGITLDEQFFDGLTFTLSTGRFQYNQLSADQKIFVKVYFAHRYYGNDFEAMSVKLQAELSLEKIETIRCDTDFLNEVEKVLHSVKPNWALIHGSYQTDAKTTPVTYAELTRIQQQTLADYVRLRHENSSLTHSDVIAQLNSQRKTQIPKPFAEFVLLGTWHSLYGIDLDPFSNKILVAALELLVRYISTRHQILSILRDAAAPDLIPKPKKIQIITPNTAAFIMPSVDAFTTHISQRPKQQPSSTLEVIATYGKEWIRRVTAQSSKETVDYTALLPSAKWLQAQFSSRVRTEAIKFDQVKAAAIKLIKECARELVSSNTFVSEFNRQIDAINDTWHNTDASKPEISGINFSDPIIAAHLRPYRANRMMVQNPNLLTTVWHQWFAQYSHDPNQQQLGLVPWDTIPDSFMQQLKGQPQLADLATHGEAIRSYIRQRATAHTICRPYNKEASLPNVHQVVCQVLREGTTKPQLLIESNTGQLNEIWCDYIQSRFNHMPAVEPEQHEALIKKWQSRHPESVLAILANYANAVSDSRESTERPDIGTSALREALQALDLKTQAVTNPFRIGEEPATIFFNCSGEDWHWVTPLHQDNTAAKIMRDSSLKLARKHRAQTGPIASRDIRYEKTTTRPPQGGTSARRGDLEINAHAPQIPSHSPQPCTPEARMAQRHYKSRSKSESRNQRVTALPTLNQLFSIATILVVTIIPFAVAYLIPALSNFNTTLLLASVLLAASTIFFSRMNAILSEQELLAECSGNFKVSPPKPKLVTRLKCSGYIPSKEDSRPGQQQSTPRIGKTTNQQQPTRLGLF